MNNNFECVDMEVIAQNEDCSVYKVNSSIGDGIMTIYNVFDGITVSYNDFHLHEFYSNFIFKKNILCIDHCREGRLEQAIDKNKRMYMTPGDLRIEDRTNHKGYFHSPLGHYHGMTISIVIDEAEKSIKEVFPDFPVDIKLLKEKLCGEYPMVFLRKNKAINHIFNEMYSIPNEIRKHYFKVKVLELIMFLYVIDAKESVKDRRYFYKSRVEKVKQIYNLISRYFIHRFSDQSQRPCKYLSYPLLTQYM